MSEDRRITDEQFYTEVCPQGRHLTDAATMEFGRDVFEGLRVLNVSGGDAFHILRAKTEDDKA